MEESKKIEVGSIVYHILEQERKLLVRYVNSALATVVYSTITGFHETEFPISELHIYQDKVKVVSNFSKAMRGIKS